MPEDVSEFHSLGGAVSSLAQSDNHFEYWKKYFLNFFVCAVHNVTATDMTHFLSAIYSVTFLSLNSQGDNKPSFGLQHLSVLPP